jgi:uncharacterized repeat protein (TIGR01451 family)
VDPLTTTKAADAATSPPGGSNGYTITISNPNATDVTLDSITDTLPAGFTYTPGSTTGATTSDPGVEGGSLTWSGPFTVPDEGSISLHFGVTVASEPGEYLNEAGGDAGGVGVVATGPTAPITVEEEGGGGTEDHVVGEVGPEGGTVATTGDVTPDNPVNTVVIVPPGTSGGVVEITEQEGNDAIDCGINKNARCLWPQLSFITSPSASVENPLTFIFTVDESFFPDDQLVKNLRMWHADTLDGIGVRIPRCKRGLEVRCLASVVRLDDGDIQYTVLAVENGKHRG